MVPQTEIRPQDAHRSHRRLTRAQRCYSLTTVPMLLLICAWPVMMFTDGADISPGTWGTVDVGMLLIAAIIIRLILIRPFVREFPPRYGPEKIPVYGRARVAFMVFLLGIATGCAFIMGNTVSGYTGDTRSVTATVTSCGFDPAAGPDDQQSASCSGTWNYAGRTYSGTLPSASSPGSREIIRIRSQDPGVARTAWLTSVVGPALPALAALLLLAFFLRRQIVTLRSQFPVAEAALTKA
jgi:hypothetical protein